MGTFKIILWVVSGIFFVFMGFLMISTISIVGVIFGVFFIVAGLWFLGSIKIIGPAEMGVFVVLGEPKSFRKSGPCFVPLFFAELVKYPQKMYNFDYKERSVVTCAGEYPVGSGKYYGSQVLEVDSVVYLNFPRERRSKEEFDIIDEEQEWEIEKGKEVEKTHPLIKILRAQVPTEEEKLKDWTEEAVLGALRVAFGKITWKEAVEDVKKVTLEAEKIFKTADGALMKAGFSQKGIRLVIAEIKLPKELESAMPYVDQQRIEAEGAPFEAQQRAEETGGAVVEIFCRMTGQPRSEVEKALRENPEAFVEKYKSFWEKSWDTVHRRMAIDGKAYLDIRTQNSLLDLLAVLKRLPIGEREERRIEKRERIKPDFSPEATTEAIRQAKRDLEKIRKRREK